MKLVALAAFLLPSLALADASPCLFCSPKRHRPEPAASTPAAIASATPAASPRAIDDVPRRSHLALASVTILADIRIPDREDAPPSNPQKVEPPSNKTPEASCRAGLGDTGSVAVGLAVLLAGLVVARRFAPEHARG